MRGVEYVHERFYQITHELLTLELSMKCSFNFAVDLTSLKDTVRDRDYWTRHSYECEGTVAGLSSELVDLLANVSQNYCDLSSSSISLKSMRNITHADYSVTVGDDR